MSNDQDTKRDPSSLSRRGFVQGTAVAGLAGLTAGVVRMEPGEVDAGDAGAPDVSPALLVCAIACEECFHDSSSRFEFVGLFADVLIGLAVVGLQFN